MIQEDYVSYEVAKLLKEKGFSQEYDVYHSMVYNEEDYEDEYEVQRMVLQTRLIKAGTLSSYPLGVPEPKCYCPTLQMAMKWLREVYNIYIAVDRGPKGYHLSIQTIPLGIVKYITREITGNTYVNSYEEAVEAAIKYCLEHLI